MHGKRFGLIVVLALLVLSGGNAHCDDWWTEAKDAKNFSAMVTFTTDYVLRGISQTDNKPAVQGSLEYKHPSGFYLGTWGSNVDDSISKGNVELDFFGGYTFEMVPDLNLDASIIYYYYPGCGHDPNKNFVEGHLGADYTFKALPLSPKMFAAYYYSPDTFGEDGQSHYVSGKVALTLPYEFTLYGLVGYQWVQGDKWFSRYHDFFEAYNSLNPSRRLADGRGLLGSGTFNAFFFAHRNVNLETIKPDWLWVCRWHLPCGKEIRP